MGALLALQDISVAFDGFKVLDRVSLAINAGELRVIIGPNGAGKTTLLDIITGRTLATGGTVLFNGERIDGQEEFRIVRRGIVRKFQTPSVYDDLSTEDNLGLSLPVGRSVGGALTFRKTSEIKEKIRAVAEQIFLVNELDKKAKHLSHGQKQWLEIGMMLMQGPSLLLLDEPVAGMTFRERRETAKLLRAIGAEKTIVVIEHDMEFVKEIAEKITVLHQGRILCEGNVEEVENNQEVIDVYLGA